MFIDNSGYLLFIIPMINLGISLDNLILTIDGIKS